MYYILLQGMLHRIITTYCSSAESPPDLFCAAALRRQQLGLGQAQGKRWG